MFCHCVQRFIDANKKRRNPKLITIQEEKHRERRAVPYFLATPSFQIKLTVCHFRLVISVKKEILFPFGPLPQSKAGLDDLEKSLLEKRILHLADTNHLLKYN